MAGSPFYLRTENLYAQGPPLAKNGHTAVNSGSMGNHDWVWLAFPRFICVILALIR